MLPSSRQLRSRFRAPSIAGSPQIYTNTKRWASAAQAKLSHTRAPKLDFVEYIDTDGRVVKWVIFNAGDGIYRCDFDSPATDTMDVLRFQAIPSCLEINQSSKSATKLEMLLGFASGDVLVFDPIRKSDAKSLQLNKNGCLNDKKVTAVRWVPGSSSEFAVAHADGVVYIYDKERGEENVAQLDRSLLSQREEGTVAATATPTSTPKHSHHNTQPPSPEQPPAIDVVKIFRNKFRSNPVSRWIVQPNGAPVYDMKFSPDGRYLAFACRDGSIRVVEYQSGRVDVLFKSFFGAVLCLDWSPDGRYILSGGEDDGITLWDVLHKCVVACGEGHSSWVTAVAFDADMCNGHLYRFGSVSQDTHLLLWDFEMETLHISRRHSKRESVSESSLPSLNRGSVVVSIGRKQDVPKIEPITSHKAHLDPLNSLVFTSDAILTACYGGIVRCWARPPRLSESHLQATNGLSLSDSEEELTDGDVEDGASRLVAGVSNPEHLPSPFSKPDVRSPLSSAPLREHMLH